MTLWCCRKRRNVKFISFIHKFRREKKPLSFHFEFDSLALRWFPRNCLVNRSFCPWVPEGIAVFSLHVVNEVFLPLCPVDSWPGRQCDVNGHWGHSPSAFFKYSSFQLRTFPMLRWPASHVCSSNMWMWVLSPGHVGISVEKRQTICKSDDALNSSLGWCMSLAMLPLTLP